MTITLNAARNPIVAAVGLALALISSSSVAQSSEQDVAQGTAIIDAAAAATAARTAGSPEFDKAKTDAPAYLLELVYKGDYLRATKGAAKKQDAYMGHLNLGLTVDGDKAFGLPGSTVYANVMHNHGNQINEIVGTQQGIDNIETSATSAKVYQLWWQQQFMDDKVSVLGGLYDLNTEFNVTESSGVFIHPSFGAGADVSQSGPSMFPTTGLGLRIRGELTDQVYGQLAILDGVPGNPNKAKGTHVRLSSKEGYYWIGEAGWRVGDDADSEKVVTKIAGGAWRFTKKQDDLLLVDSNNNPEKQTNSGFYVVAEQQLLKHEDGRRIMGFARYGVADKDVNEMKDNLVVGVALEGVLAQRPDDTLGLGMSRVTFSQKAQDAQINASEQVLKSEMAIELTYQAKITDWLSVQPEVQYIKTSADPSRENDLVVGVRFEIGMSW